MKSLLVSIVAAVLLVGCASTRLGARSGSTKSEKEKTKILTVAAKYYGAFINKKYTVIGDITQTPFVSVRNTETLTYQTKQQLIDYYKTIREPLDNLNYSHSENYFRNVHFFNDHLAWVESAYGRINRSGEVFHKGKGIYLYRKTNENWYLVGRIEAAKTEKE